MGCGSSKTKPMPLSFQPQPVPEKVSEHVDDHPEEEPPGCSEPHVSTKTSTTSLIDPTKPEEEEEEEEKPPQQAPPRKPEALRRGGESNGIAPTNTTTPRREEALQTPEKSPSNRTVSAEDAPFALSHLPSPPLSELRNGVIIKREPRASANGRYSYSGRHSVLVPLRSSSDPNGPSPQFPHDQMFSCFNDGRLFRLVDGRRHAWAYFNATEDYEMQISVTFGPESVVEPLGEAIMTCVDERKGIVRIELVVAPGETAPFMCGEYNGFTSRYDPVLVQEEY